MGLEPDASKLGPEERAAIDRVYRLTGYRATTCPREALYRPEVARACQWKSAHLSAVIEPDPPAVLVDAVGAVAQGEAEYLDYVRRTPRQPNVVAAMQALPGPISSPDQLPRRKAR